MPYNERLHRLATGRHGVFTTAEARRLGLTTRQVEGGCRSGYWARVHRGVYRLAGRP